MSTKRRALFSAVCAIVCTGLLAAASTDVLTPHKVAKIRSVSQAVLSPDGTRAAYGLRVQRDPLTDDNGGAWQELHVVDIASGDSRPYISGHVNVSGIAWTADGQSIAFLQRKEGDKHTSLYVIAVDGGEARRAVSLDRDIQAFSFSPDGGRVALIAAAEDDAELKNLRDKGFNAEIYEEDWRPRQILLAEPFQDERAPRILEIGQSAFDVAWSPAGDLIAAALAPTPLDDDRYMHQRIHLVDAATGRIQAHLDNAGKIGEISWSPDGKHLAAVAAADINDPAPGRLLIGSSSGGAMKDVLGEGPFHVSHIGWQSPDTVMFVADFGVWTAFEKVNIDGSGRKRIIATGGPVFTSLSMAADGLSGVFIGSSPSHPEELFAMKHGDAGPRRLTDSNPWLEEIRLARQEVVTFKARDGLEIEGILIHPLDEEAGRRYPLVLYVHGGPEAHHRNGWLTGYSSPGQMAAARGMAVFHTNYRGSTGRGLAFSKLSQADPTGREFDDLVDAVDHLIASGLVDKDKVGVTGGSYGGYATAWCSTYYSDRFAAGVMFAGISDKISKVGTTDISEEEYLVHARMRPWDDWEKFLHRSPVFYADRGKTPLLILHGTDDPRVNVGQARELYRHLKLRGSAPVRLVLYPGEHHGNSKAAARLDYSLRALRWLEYYLKGPGGDPPDWKIDYADPSIPKPTMMSNSPSRTG